MAKAASGTPNKGLVAYWTQEISSAKKREKDFRTDGDRINKIYDGSKSKTTPFNILFSNTETLLPALYSAIPSPVVQRRFKDDDPTALAASQAGKRMLEFLIDTNVDGYETFDEAMRSATLDALLPGRGITCEKYDADIGYTTDSVDDSDPAPTDETPAAEPSPYKKSELVCSDARSWNRVYFGYAKKWSKVPWVAFEEQIDKKEAERLFGAEVAGRLVYSATDDDEEKRANRDQADEGLRKTASVYQIWDKSARKIRYVAEQYKDDFLKVEDDPLGLTGFFNMPRPLQFIEKSNDLLPTALYILYENQAKELNRIQIRINRIVEALKARGIYDSELGGDIADLMKADDNELVPADKSSSLAAEKGLQNSIWFMPLEQLVATLQQLYAAREACKQVIYEITGIADIMRGASNASETLGAQQIKQSWGTLRLKRLQKEVQRYARDLLRIKLEIAATKFSEETWAAMTGLPYLTAMQAEQAQSIVQAAGPQVPGQPVQPTVQQAQQALQKPKWADVLGVLKDDMQRAYRIDIETNSTVEPEAVEDQKNIAEVMNALGQFLNSVSPLVIQGVMPFQAAQSMMLAIVRRFRFGDEIEDYIKQMQAPKPQDDGKDAAAQKQVADAQDAARQAEFKQQQAELAKQHAESEKALGERSASLDFRELKADTEKQVFEIEKKAHHESIAHKSAAASKDIEHKRTVAGLENSRFKTENVVNQKADSALGGATEKMNGIVAQLAELVNQTLQANQQQQQQNSADIAQMVKAITAERVTEGELSNGKKMKSRSRVVMDQGA